MVDHRPGTYLKRERTASILVDPPRTFLSRAGVAPVAAGRICMTTTTTPAPKTTKAGGPEGRAGFAGRSLGGLRCRRGG